MRPIAYDLAWGSHLPILMKVMGLTSGPVLELGAGLYSTPFLYWMCKDQGRAFTSYENDYDWWKMVWDIKDAKRQGVIDQEVLYIDRFTKAEWVANWDDVDLSGFWDVAFIDHSPSSRRIKEIRALANNANYVVVHDTQRNYKFCDYKRIYPLFKYKFDYTKSIPHTTVLSNFKDLSCLKH